MEIGRDGVTGNLGGSFGLIEGWNGPEGELGGRGGGA